METTEKIFTYENDFTAFNAAIDAGQVCRVDEEMFYYWLEVLPPIYMNAEQIIEIDGAKFKKMCSFGFAEGREYITDFWRNKTTNKHELITASQEMGDDNKGYEFGINWLDDNSNVIDCEWFKTEDDRVKALQSEDAKTCAFFCKRSTRLNRGG